MIAHLDGNNIYLRMRVLVDPENFIRESSADALDTLEIEKNFFEAIEAHQQPLGLRAGNKLFSFIQQKLQGNVGSGKIDVLPGIEPAIPPEDAASV